MKRLLTTKSEHLIKCTKNHNNSTEHMNALKLEMQLVEENFFHITSVYIEPQIKAHNSRFSCIMTHHRCT